MVYRKRTLGLIQIKWPLRQKIELVIEFTELTKAVK
jgi:hypothetical protein